MRECLTCLELRVFNLAEAQGREGKQGVMRMEGESETREIFTELIRNLPKILNNIIFWSFAIN